MTHHEGGVIIGDAPYKIRVGKVENGLQATLAAEQITEELDNDVLPNLLRQYEVLEPDSTRLFGAFTYEWSGLSKPLGVVLTVGENVGPTTNNEYRAADDTTESYNLAKIYTWVSAQLHDHPDAFRKVFRALVENALEVPQLRQFTPEEIGDDSRGHPYKYKTLGLPIDRLAVVKNELLRYDHVRGGGVVMGKEPLRPFVFSHRIEENAVLGSQKNGLTAKGARAALGSLAALHRKEVSRFLPLELRELLANRS